MGCGEGSRWYQQPGVFFGSFGSLPDRDKCVLECVVHELVVGAPAPQPQPEPACVPVEEEQEGGLIPLPTRRKSSQSARSSRRPTVSSSAFIPILSPRRVQSDRLRLGFPESVVKR